MSVYEKIKAFRSFPVPDNWQEIKTIDMHTGGEPLRVILDGYPELQGNNILEYRRFAKEQFDHLRTALMLEPRGHADMYGCLLLPPNSDDGDFGIIFLHNEGYSTMCGHAIIAITTLAVEMRWLDTKDGDNIVKIDTPCGRITSIATIKNNKIQEVRFHGVPSFVVALDQEIEVEGIGKIHYDLAYGGAFYAYVDANQLKLELTPDNYRNIITAGTVIKEAIIASKQTIQHPFEADLSFLYGTIFIGEPVSQGVDSRNVCVFAQGEVDRSPTGSGVAGRMAIHHARSELIVGQTMKIESITGSVFEGKIIEEVDYGPFRAVIPEVSGTAHITGRHSFLIDPEDPFKNGFFLR